VILDYVLCQHRPVRGLQQRCELDFDLVLAAAADFMVVILEPDARLGEQD